MEIKQVLVIGAGQMGSGIAQVFATANYNVILNDLTAELTKQGLTTINNNLLRDVNKGRLTAESKDEIISRITLCTDLAEGAKADFVIEAVREDLQLKQTLFAKLAEIVKPKAILATNTSSLPITEIAAVTKDPSRVIGMHFMNPVPVMELVEIIKGLLTAQEVFEVVEKVTTQLGKTPVEVNDSPGFVSNRILMPMINEAIFTLYEGVATVEAIDSVLKLGMNHPLGPLALADLIGLDTCLSIMETLHDGFGDDKYRPCPLLRKYVVAGRLGRKTGEGFYKYS